MNLKGLKYDYVPVNLLKGEQHEASYRAVNPSGSVPSLELTHAGKQLRISQSLAIIEYLEELHPQPALYPKDPYQRARSRMMAELMNSGIQPLHNLQVLNHVETELKGDKKAWAAHWLTKGLVGLQAMAEETAGTYLVGENPSVADVCLVPQLYAARRFGADVEQFGLLLRIEATCASLPAFAQAHADKQPDAVANP